MRYFAFASMIAGLIAVLFSLVYSQPAASQEAPYDWKSDWAIEEGFALSVDTEGYQLPSAIAFVPNPGSAPKDPLYFVTELRGKVKVVTNDRTIYTFAEKFSQLDVEQELPDGKGQGGVAGICLDPQHGYVFVTFAYQDKAKVLRNNIIRFETEPETFAVAPKAQVDFAEVFAPYRSGLAHQIGPCQVKDETLYVSVGEAWQSTEAQKLDSLVGKIIRMTLDGKPVPENPFYEDDDIEKAANYIWAYGFRNPFGQKFVGDRLFVADNGQNIDRFLEVQEAQNYLWDGNDWSIATNAAFVFAPSLAPVQLDYYPEGSSLFPEAYARKFFLAISGTWDKGKIPGIMTFNYDFEENRLSQPPKYFLKYRGNIFQMVVGLAFGPDGLYFSPILPNQEGKTAILKITYDPTNPHPYSVLQEEDPEALMIAKGCFGCHRLGDDRGYGGTGGPDLAYKELMPRLEARLLSEGYVNSLKELDKLDTEPLPAYKEARQEVAAADGSERIHTWVKYRLLEPKFDNLYTLMPNVGLTEKEALLITDFLLTPSQNQAEVAPAFMGITLPRRFGYWHLLFAAVAGVLLTLFALNLPRVVRSFKSRGKTGTVAG